MFLAVLLIGATPASAQVSRRADPSWSTNGPVMAVLQVGNRIYVGGEFTQLRSPSGQVVARDRLAVLDATTGNVINGWAPQLDAEVLSLAASADGTRVYVGGEFGKEFTKISGIPQHGFAQFTDR